MIVVNKAGRTKRTGKDYTEFRRSLHESQNGLCYQCGKVTSLAADILSDWSFHVHHENGRGMGGGRRDDTPESCKGICGKCHRGIHHQ